MAMEQDIFIITLSYSSAILPYNSKLFNLYSDTLNQSKYHLNHSKLKSFKIPTI